MPLAQRAAAHAALADELRLQVVDLLAGGDLTPGEIRRRIPVASNLLAHHLGVLEAAGIVNRRRSEADGRRVYIALRRPTVATATEHHDITRVLFVCTGNSARSQIAEALWREHVTGVAGISGGTHPADRVEPEAVRTARRHGLDLADATPRSIAEVAVPGDLIVTVCDSAREELGERATVHWSIPDPVRDGSREAFEAAFDELSRRVSGLTPHVHAA
ncbi:MAG: helix-turn-helix domain-containing protein [Actinomycetales bacterium]|nr:helix-turn-helix domain-containing protein [Actinomycetales bacterium]